MSNPIIRLEVLRRFRTPAAAWGIPLVVLLPGIVVISVYAATVTNPIWSERQIMEDPMGGWDAGPQTLPSSVGPGMFAGVAITLFLTLIVLVPAFVGGSIAGERHSQTLQPLQLTAMTPRQIIHGKLVSSLAYLIAVLLCAAPVMAIPFLLGGLPAWTVIWTFVMILVVCVEFASISLAVSSILSRPAPAIIVSLIAVGFVTFAPMIATGLFMAGAASGNRNFDPDTTWTRFVAGVSPISLGSWIPLPVADEQVEFATNGFKVWTVVCFVAICVLSLRVATRRVSAPVERDR